MEAILKFHGTDWVGMMFGLLSAYYIAKHRRWGFIFAAIGGLGWMAFGFITQSIPSIVANVLFIAINVRGFVRWKQRGQGEEEKAVPQRG